MSQGYTKGVPIDTDVNLGSGSPSDELVPSQKAVKTYLDAGARYIRETSGPTTLTVLNVADGQLLKRAGSTIIGTFILMVAVAATQEPNVGASVGTTNNTRAASIGQAGTLV